MPQLILELFSEEIPARLQAGAAKDLRRMFADKLDQAGLNYDQLSTFAGPRRLSLVAEGLPPRQADRVEERKGPRTSAPEAAILGFLRSVGAVREDLIERDGAWFARTALPGRSTEQIVAEAVVSIVQEFPWPKAMVWGDGSLRWVRPLHRILCVFDRRVVPFELDGLASGDLSEGHRFMGAGVPFCARDFDEYKDALAANFVVLDPEERKRRIIGGARGICEGRGLVLLEDDGLLEEVAGMAEWPTPLLGDIDVRFLSLPPEVIRTTMRTHQRYFALSTIGDPGVLAPHFIAVSNLEARDGGAMVAAGNARVLAARLQDAAFFLAEDLHHSLDSRIDDLKGVTFHAKLGSMFERAGRIERLARHIAPLVGADEELAAIAAKLAKADLTTAMVGEFPELQGVMGGRYAAAEGKDPRIVDAIRDHYKPQGPSEATPRAPVSAAVALADKMDTILAFFSIGETPTGSRDPFALRRAALGVIRILLDNKLRVPLGEMVKGSPFPGEGMTAFFADRLKVMLREGGARHDLVDSVFALGDDDLVRVVARIQALAAFLATADGANLISAYKRAGNILNAEQRRGPLPKGPPRRPSEPEQEVRLIDALCEASPRIDAALAAECFDLALAEMAQLRGPVDAFFDGVLVNSTIASERDNRLRLLGQVREVLGRAADFSLVSG